MSEHYLCEVCKTAPRTASEQEQIRLQGICLECGPVKTGRAALRRRLHYTKNGVLNDGYQRINITEGVKE